jgi:CDP-diacylglycerol--serine O-phosphatidyltransferase
MSSVFSPLNRPRLLGKGRRFPIKRRVPVRMLIPNLFTLMALAAGLTAIRMGVEQRFELAIAFILVAALLDALDGRIARLLKATSKFGAELDSLADFVNFGVAPAIIIFTWALDGLRSIGWIAVLIYALCAALRLARFNVMLEQGEGEPRWKKNYFVGMPAPAAAISVMLPLYFAQLGVPGVEVLRPLILVHVLFIALMMVSRVPTFSGKLIGGNIDRDHVAPLLVLTILLAALVFTYTWLMLVLGTLAYLAIIPYGVIRYRRNLARDEAEARAAGAGLAGAGGEANGGEAVPASDGEPLPAEAPTGPGSSSVH